MDAFSMTTQYLLADVIAILPNILVAIILIVIGWLVGAGVGKLIARVVGALRVDAALRSAKIDQVVERAGFTFSSGGFLGGLVKWFIIAVFFVVALDVLNLGPVTEFLSTVVFFYVPKVIAAALILLVAALLAQFVHNIVAGTAKATDIGSPYFLGTVARWAIWIFAILAALAQLDVAPTMVETLFTGIVVALALALGLSFGLGGRDAAALYINHIAGEVEKKSRR